MSSLSTDISLGQALLQAVGDYPAAALTIASTTRPGQTALADLYRQGQHFAANLVRLGIKPGDIVAVQLPGWAEWQIAASGIAQAGAVLLPIVSIYGASEVGFILRQSGAKLIVTPDVWRGKDYAQMLAQCGDLPLLGGHLVVGDTASAGTIGWEEMLAPVPLPPAIQRGADDLAMLIYTSGTTSEPKGVRHTSRSILSELETLVQVREGCDDIRTLSPWPPGHVAGALSMLRHMLLGETLVVMDQWEPALAAQLIEQHRITHCSFTPFHLAGLLAAAGAEGRDLSSLSHPMVGAAPVPPTLIQACQDYGLRTFRCYGSTEMPTVSMGFPEDPIEKRLTTEGRPMPGAEIRIVDEDGHDVEEGELALRGPDLFAGYTDEAFDRESFLPDGWFRTGDIGRIDPDGYLLITDRKKDVIIRGGENIASREVEEVLFHHPGIIEVAVVAAPDPRMGEVVCAFVVPRPGTTPDLESVRAHFAASGVARQKTPERIELVAALPRNSTGKVLKHELRARLRAEQSKG